MEDPSAQHSLQTHSVTFKSKYITFSRWKKRYPSTNSSCNQASPWIRNQTMCLVFWFRGFAWFSNYPSEIIFSKTIKNNMIHTGTHHKNKGQLPVGKWFPTSHSIQLYIHPEMPWTTPLRHLTTGNWSFLRWIFGRRGGDPVDESLENNRAFWFESNRSMA